MKSRITQILESLNEGNLSAMARKLGLTQGGLNNAFSRNSFSADVLQRILDTYPEISAEWLMRGEGKMYRSDSGDSTTIGDGSVAQIGNANKAGLSSDTIDKLITEMSAQRTTFADALARRDAQTERLLAILEKQSETTK